MRGSTSGPIMRETSTESIHSDYNYRNQLNFPNDHQSTRNLEFQFSPQFSATLQLRCKQPVITMVPSTIGLSLIRNEVQYIYGQPHPTFPLLIQQPTPDTLRVTRECLILAPNVN